MVFCMLKTQMFIFIRIVSSKYIACKKNKTMHELCHGFIYFTVSLPGHANEHNTPPPHHHQVNHVELNAFIFPILYANPCTYTCSYSNIVVKYDA